MAARHFAKTLREPDGEEEPKGWEQPEEPKEPEGEAGHPGDHFEEPSFLEFTPPPASTFVVPVPQNNEADARARDRIEEIFRELEEEERQAKLEEEERRARLEEERRARLEEEERRARLEEERRARLEEEERRARLEEERRARLEEESKTEPEPESTLDAEPAPKSHLELRTEYSQPFTQVDRGLLSDIPLDDVESGELSLEAAVYAPDPEPEQTSGDDERIPPDKTAELPVRARARLLEEQGRTPQVVREDAPKQGNEQYVASADRRERLEVSTDRTPMEAARSNPSVTSTATALATKKRPLGFFARIGAFIARLFHMDD